MHADTLCVQTLNTTYDLEKEQRLLEIWILRSIHYDRRLVDMTANFKLDAGR